MVLAHQCAGKLLDFNPTNRQVLLAKLEQTPDFSLCAPNRLVPREAKFVVPRVFMASTAAKASYRALS